MKFVKIKNRESLTQSGFKKDKETDRKWMKSIFIDCVFLTTCLREVSVEKFTTLVFFLESFCLL